MAVTRTVADTVNPMFGYRDTHADPEILDDAFGRMAAGCGMAMGLVDALVHEALARDPHRYRVLRHQRREALTQIGFAFAAYDAAHGQRGDGPAARAFRERWLATPDPVLDPVFGGEDDPPQA